MHIINNKEENNRSSNNINILNNNCGNTISYKNS